MKIFKTLFYFLLFTFTLCKAQTLQGHAGLFFIPTADLFKDGDVTLGINYINRELLSFGNYSEDGLSPFLTITFLPFLEFNFRVTRLINSKVTTQGIGDRTISARLKIINEENILPAILIGVHDLAAVYGGSNAVHNNSLYIVASKNISVNTWLKFIGFHLGYGTNKIKARTHHFNGLFGGVNFAIVNMLEIMGEYDGKHSNTGIRLRLFDHFSILGGLLQLKHFSGGASVSIVL